MRRLRLPSLLLFAGTTALAACTGSTGADAGPDATDASDIAHDTAMDSTVDDMPMVDASGDAVVEAGTPRLAITAVDTRFVTREHMLASFEMQQSGEPFAEDQGRNVAGYDRNRIPVDEYIDPTATLPDGGTPPAVIDLPGFIAAIESYEYSKQPMNNLALESGAGVSLAFGPLLNPTQATGAAALTLLRDRVQHAALISRIAVTGMPGYAVVPAPTNDPMNPLGWRGLWPVMDPFVSFDPTIAPYSGVSGMCSITPGDGDDGRAGAPRNPVGDFECDYNTLHLANRSAQVTPRISPGASGWTSWKYALWITNYLQIMHDTFGNAIGEVAPAELANVGNEGNTIVGMTAPPFGDPVPGYAGTYIGAADIEGFQAAIMIEELDNSAAHWLTSLTTTDGTTLSGFASTSAALAYDYNAPLRWFPHEVAVQEVSDTSGFPRPASYSVASARSDLMDLLGLIGGYSQLYALTDHGNADVGAAQSAQVYFDGDPFAADNQLADGESTLHDHALALLKVAFVNLDRAHRHSSGILADSALLPAPASGPATVATPSAAYTVVSLRALRRSLGSQLTLYSNATPDTAVTATPLDATGLAGAPMGQSFAQRITTLIRAHADLLLDHLTDSTGHAFAGWNADAATTTGAGNIESYAGAVRGLLESYLATGDTRYRDRAEAVWDRLETTFWDTSVRIYRVNADTSDTITYTPFTFALVQSALREMYKLVGSRPGHDALATQLLDRYARLNKVVLNGWDDRDGDSRVNWPDECINVQGGLARGGMQMGERALTGELGLLGHTPVPDRDRDCVPEISYVRRPAALAGSVQFTITHP